MSEFVTAQGGGMKWQLQKDCAEWVLQRVAQNIARAGEAEGWQLVKENNVRAIFTVPLFDSQERKGYLKRFKCRGWKDVLKHLIVPSKAAAEWRAANRLIAFGVPTARPLAVAERRSYGLLRESVLLSEAVPDSAPLSDLLRSCEENVRGDLLNKLARLARSLHDRGCYHCDLHVGNVLASGPAKDAELFVLDLHRVRFRRSLSLVHRLENMAMIWASVRTLVSEQDRRQLFRAYAEGIPEIESDFERCAAWLGERVREMCRVHFRSRTKRCLMKSSGFDVSSRSGYRIYRQRNVPEELLMKAIEAHVKSAAEVVKRSEDGAVSRVALEPRHGVGSTITACVKENSYNLAAQVKGIFRSSRGRAAWVAGHGLAVRGIRTCHLFGLVEKRAFGLVQQSFLVMEDLKDALAFDRYIYEKLAAGAPKRNREFTRAAADLFAHLHESGIYHADLKASNILVRESLGGWEFFLVDLDNVCFPWRVSLSRRAKNLAQMNSALRRIVTNSDRIRFFHRYAGRCPGVMEPKALLKMVVSETSRRDCVWERSGVEEPKPA